MTNLRFYSGLKEIGGTVVAVETDKAICIFDFGYSNSDRIDSKVSVRKGNEVLDYIKLGILNSLDGVYEKNIADKLGKKAYGDTDKQVFVIISHMHIDHMGGLGALAQELPVYMSSDSATLYHEMGIMGELEYREHSNVIPVDYDASFTVEDIKVTCVQVDHDVIGACGFLIETKEGKICYTGDYRFHGYHPEISRGFAEKCKGADVMISEGVTISFADVDTLSLTEPERESSEYTLLEKVADYSANEEGLIVINNYNRNVERVHHFCEIIKKNGRTLVLDQIQAEYVAAFYEDDFSVYLPEGGTISAPRIKDHPVVTRKDLLENPKAYVLQQDYKDSYELFDLAPVISKYLHMDGAPLGDYDPSFGIFYKMLDAIGINVERCGLGGHAEPYYLRKTVDEIQPRILIPLHSFRPEQLKSEKAGKIILPEIGDVISL
ncbi:MBL fold metallo-hydrolase [Butyrivibrio sp. YAB3001]|uniref:MBL fold metallo-hydrolase n=1 Tax=Butyrivibrio sp. YAB3001 TaxID=1520812 RepID=UPI0008F6572A|nr:MBL fold metallo-hydrolase [Butyrivibrio sp. YAB3001]SFC35172.1 Beta-lactamase superfamily domain-containing protein [Butyrivibrio sp. YAB3001]